MHALDRVVKRRRAVLLLAATLGTSAVTAAGADAAAIKKCPTASAISGYAGVKLTGGHSVASGGTLLCTYSYKDYGSLQIEVAKIPGVTASIFKLLTTKAAQAAKGKIKVISGVGSAAFEYTNPNLAISADKIADTTVSVLDGTTDVTVDGDLPANAVVAVAKKVG